MTGVPRPPLPTTDVGRPRPPAPRNPAPIGPAAIRAAYRAHQTDQHNGRVDTTCRTCRRYLRGIARAAARAELTAHRTARPAGYATGPDGALTDCTYVTVTGQVTALPLDPTT